MSFSEGEAILEKILENTPYTSIYDEFPEEEKEVKPSPNQQEEIHATESKIQSNPSNDLVAEKSPTKVTQTLWRMMNPILQSSHLKLRMVFLRILGMPQIFHFK